MKKILISCYVFFLMLFMSYSAMVSIYFNLPNGVGVPYISYVHVYYGPQFQTYTNQFLWPVGSSTNLAVAFDAENCRIMSIGNAIKVPVYGLQLGQQFYCKYNFVYSDGSESLPIFESQCGFTVTNSADLLLPPIDLRVVE